MALQGIGDLKSPDLDGYNAKNFKSCWGIVKNDVIDAVKEFFENDRLFLPFNRTLVTLIPKSEDAKSVRDYRPIAGCSTFYKIISKILTARLGSMMPSVISKAQAAFVPGQNIHNHILQAYKLIKGYSRRGGTPRIMMQLDLQKAYDMVDWTALETIMKELDLPGKFITWIMNIVTTVSYVFNINGEISNDMFARRGIRQGDPISPLLFVFIMEYFNRLMEQLQLNPNFNHHAKYEKLGITHLTFVVDVLLFCRGDTVSMEMMIKTITEFSNTTGLVINPTKCRIYFGGINSVDKASFQSVAPFCEGQLPFRYLGVPLTDKKLNIKYYLPLIDKVLARVNHWTSRLLTAAGRLQLVRCTISAVVQFWMQCLPLPKSVINKIDSICRRFVWSGGTEGKKNPVAWTTVCRPRKLGGLDVLNLHVWNQITLLKCLWNICKKD